MDSLYTNFLRFPSLIHANAKPSHFENEMAWRFSKADIRLHTGYADFRYGAFVPRWKVQNFLTQLGKSGFDKEKLRQADHYFSIWTNQYPWLLSNPPYMAKGGTKATDGDIAYLSTLDHYTYDAVRHLSRSLTAHQSEAPQDYFDRREEVPPLVYRDVRSSCANDRCLFMTNLDPFVKPTDIDFDYRNITSILAWEKAYAKLSTIPNSIEWDEFSYHQAVDNDPNTCWHTIRTPKKHDYFGLMFVGSTRSDKVTLYTTNDLLKQKYHPEKQFSISVLQNDDTWIQCKLTMIDNNNSLKATKTGAALNNVQRVTFNLNCPNIKYFKALKVTFLRDQKEPFEICGLTLDNVSV
ncbi:hypothetical protein BDF20DRAFT_905106 [Mycotypha africana]|uniref:uncharacterized protein n=1 Tax=Mycotypha africana TaxID=64632 RepID=UPI002300301D|nr:uncharacterized protein BDF20DRAFT_905106 [Mycotypha africana]KAI8988625.1 hypothetical protein BDF20DRAFT_905106 [Mycotypha africana]